MIRHVLPADINHRVRRNIPPSSPLRPSSHDLPSLPQPSFYSLLLICGAYLARTIVAIITGQILLADIVGPGFADFDLASIGLEHATKVMGHIGPLDRVIKRAIVGSPWLVRRQGRRI